MAHVGNNGLMRFALDKQFIATGGGSRETIVLGCINDRYFTDPLRRTGAKPLLWTTGLMALNTCTLKAALNGWGDLEPHESISEHAAKANDLCQKCGINGARRLLVSRW